MTRYLSPAISESRKTAADNPQSSIFRVHLHSDILCGLSSSAWLVIHRLHLTLRLLRAEFLALRVEWLRRFLSGGVGLRSVRLPRLR
jgi:hypothetical protein